MQFTLCYTTEQTICLLHLPSILVSPFYTLANSEDPDEMQHNAAFYQGLHYLLIQKKQSSEKKIQFYLEIITCDPSIYTMKHPKFIVSYQVEEPISIQRVKM